MDTYIKAYEYGPDPAAPSIITMQVRPNTGMYEGEDGTSSEPTDTIWTEIDGLTAANFVASIVGGPLSYATDAGLTDKYVSRVKINAGDWIYTAGFEKPVASDTLTLTNGDTIADTDTVYYDYLPDGNGTAHTDIQRTLLGQRFAQIEESLQTEIDATEDLDLYRLLVNELGCTKN